MLHCKLKQFYVVRKIVFRKNGSLCKILNMDTFPDIYDLITPNYIYKYCHVTCDFYLIINVATIFLNIIAFKP